MAIRLFGFSLGKKEATRQEDPDQLSFTLPQEAIDDGAVTVTQGAYYGTYVDLEGSVRNELELITRYREMSLHPECEQAIDEIVNEAISKDEDGKVVEIVLDNLKQPETIKNKIREEFDNVLRMYNFSQLGDELFKRWYIDGRIYFHVIVSEKNPKQGIKELRYIDPRKIRKVREITKDRDPKTGAEVIKSMAEYFVFSDRGMTTQTYTAAVNQGVKVATDSVINVTSGMLDGKSVMVISHLHKAIKPLNQLRMIEDAIVIYRLSRAPERRIFYIDVGNLPKGKAEQYLRDIMVKYRNKLVYDANTGEIRDERKHLCLDMNTKVPLLDGRTLTLTQIAEEYKTKKLWAYSTDPKTGKFVPGLITWAGVSRPNAEVMKLTFDNGKSVICTPDHKFPLWDKGLVEAQNMKVGDSVIPLYRRKHNITPGAKKNKEYEQIWENDKNTWTFTHKAVSLWKDDAGLDNEFVFNESFKESKKNTIHHKNINRFDNTPENLVRMDSIDHILYHQSSGSNSGKIGGLNCYKMRKGLHNKNHPDYKEWHIKGGKIGGRVSSMNGKSQENLAKGRSTFSNLMEDSNFHDWFTQRQRDGWTEEKRKTASDHAKRNKLSERGNVKIKELWKNEEYAKNKKKKYTVEYTQEIFDFVKECATKQLSKAETVKKLNESETLINTWKQLNSVKCISKKQKSFDKFIEDDVYKVTKQYTSCSYSQLKRQSQYRNHKIIKIEYLDEKIDTGCLTIDGGEIYHSHHTFGLDVGVYTQNSMLEDFWLPRREGGKGTEITTLPGGQNLGELQDVEYFQKKLYQSLSVPISRLQLQPAGIIGLGRVAEVTRDEVKFTKFILRLRSRFAQIFNNALRIQLSLKGVCTLEEWDEFKEFIHYDFKSDNNFFEMRDAELLRERISLISTVDPYIGKYYSQNWVRKNILKMTEDEIKEMQAEIEDEQKSMELANPQDTQQNPQQYVPQDQGTNSVQGDVQNQEQINLIDSSDMNNKFIQFDKLRKSK